MWLQLIIYQRDNRWRLRSIRSATRACLCGTSLACGDIRVTHWVQRKRFENCLEQQFLMRCHDQPFVPKIWKGMPWRHSGKQIQRFVKGQRTENIRGVSLKDYSSRSLAMFSVCEYAYFCCCGSNSRRRTRLCSPVWIPHTKTDQLRLSPRDLLLWHSLSCSKCLLHVRGAIAQNTWCHSDFFYFYNFLVWQKLCSWAWVTNSLLQQLNFQSTLNILIYGP